MAGTTETITLVPGRGGLKVPKMEFDESSSIADVSLFFRRFWVANRMTGAYLLRGSDTVETVTPFTGENPLAFRNELYIPGGGSKNWSLLRSKYRSREGLYASGYNDRLEILVPPSESGPLTKYLTIDHRVGVPNPWPPLDMYDLMYIDYIGGTVGFNSREGVDQEQVNSHRETPAKLVMARVMNECVEFLRA